MVSFVALYNVYIYYSLGQQIKKGFALVSPF